MLCWIIPDRAFPYQGIGRDDPPVIQPPEKSTGEGINRFAVLGRRPHTVALDKALTPMLSKLARQHPPFTVEVYSAFVDTVEAAKCILRP